MTKEEKSLVVVYALLSIMLIIIGIVVLIKPSEKTTESIPTKLSEQVIKVPTKQQYIDYCSYSYSEELYNVAVSKSEKYNIPLYVIYALIDTESTMKKFAKSCADCRGLCQVSKIALQEYNNRNKTSINFDSIYDIETNLEVGLWYFSFARKLTNETDWRYIYGGYNVGCYAWKTHREDYIEKDIDSFRKGNKYNALNRFESCLLKSEEYFYGKLLTIK